MGIVFFSGASCSQALNSNSLYISVSFSVSGSDLAKSSIPNSSSTSVFIFTNSWARSSISMEDLKFSPTFPPIDSEFSFTPCMSLYSLSHFTAVLGPTLSTPGTLSDLSPINAR